jgi:hypothetical protein
MDLIVISMVSDTWVKFVSFLRTSICGIFSSSCNNAATLSYPLSCIDLFLDSTTHNINKNTRYIFIVIYLELHNYIYKYIFIGINL